MQIVIDIPEEEYKDFCERYIGSHNTVINAMCKGTPLPKGHGRLIDADELNNSLREQQRGYEHTFGIRQPINEAVRDGIIIAGCHIDHAPTIIEADKEVEE